MAAKRNPVKGKSTLIRAERVERIEFKEISYTEFRNSFRSTRLMRLAQVSVHSSFFLF